MDGFWWMVYRGWFLVDSFWWMVSGRWFLVDGFWYMASGGWFLVDGFWWVVSVGDGDGDKTRILIRIFDGETQEYLNEAFMVRNKNT